MKDPAQAAIEKLGWHTHTVTESDGHTTSFMCQATQRGYRTPWLDSWAEVLRWIRGNKETKGTK